MFVRVCSCVCVWIGARGGGYCHTPTGSDQ